MFKPMPVIESWICTPAVWINMTFEIYTLQSEHALSLEDKQIVKCLE